MPSKTKRCRSRSVVRARKRRAGAATAAGDPRTLPAQQGAYSSHEISTFEVYARTENFLSRKEHAQFFPCLRSPLPTSFIARSPASRAEFQRLTQRATPLPGILGGYQLWDENDSSVRQWLTQKTISGHVSRQEFVSMIPVLLLNIQQDHVVLDLCASPGSKTIQAVDALFHKQEKDDGKVSSPKGFVVANELDPKRSYILAKRCSQTLRDRQQRLAIVCHNATKFPNVAAPLVRGAKPSAGLYDRIICDVPCSGDGTLRKDTKVWKTWHPTYGRDLHSMQLRIAKRAIALLKIGGYMTYSTCSFHPVENEAVVAALLQTGCVELMVPNERISKDIVYRQGLSHWQVLDDDCVEVSRHSTSWPKTCWPPSSNSIALQLLKCVRMVPMDNDTGGFFIALIRKVRDFPSKSSAPLGATRAPLVTPQHHHLYVGHEDTDCLYTKRSSTSEKTFAVSRQLAQHLLGEPGSAKLNIVYAGKLGS